MESNQWEEQERVIEEVIDFYRKKLLESARRMIPHITPEDLMQVNDFPELENNPEFRYEEGVLSGILTLQMALRSARPMQLDTSRPAL
jgi:hypothetical protein